MHTRPSAKNPFSRAFPALAVAVLLGLPAALSFAARAAATQNVAHATITAGSSEPAGSNISLTVGLTPNGDGSSCGFATSVQVNVGDLVDFCYTVTNHSSTDLAYSTLVDSVDGTLLDFTPTSIPAGRSYVYHRPVRARTSDVHRATWTARSDFYQYVQDDTQPSDFVDIRSSGSLVDLSTGGWSTESGLDIPFPFAMFGGNPVNHLCISNLGFIRVEASGCYDTYLVWLNFSLSSTADSDLLPFSDGNLIAPYWDELDNVQGGVYSEVQGQAPNRRLIVQWDRAHAVFYGPTADPAPTQGRMNMEAILGEDGSIAFQYQKTTFDYVDAFGRPHPELDNGRDATIGLSAMRANGGNAVEYSYYTVMPHPAPSSVIYTPSPATVYSAQANVEIDAGGPLIEASPALIAAGAPSGGDTPVTAALSIGNGGDRPLDWSIEEGSEPAGYRPPPARRATATGEMPYGLLQQATAHAQENAARSVETLAAASGTAHATASVASQGTPCGTATPGLIAHDDGVASNGYAGTQNASSVAVDKFTPTYYPAALISVCVAFVSYRYPVSSVAPVHYEVVVYDDTGPGGSPGNELGSVGATTMGTPYPQAVVFNDSVDISGLGIDVASGSVYIGVRWNPDQDQNNIFFIAVDDNGTDGAPLNPPEGGYFDTGNGVFIPTTSDPTFRRYKSLMVRAVETAPGCTHLQDVPWLSIAPASGSVAPGGAASIVTLTLDPTGLADGTHTANLCLTSGYETVNVPVAFSIGADFPIATLGSDAVGFSLPQGGVGTGTFTIGNAGTSGSLLHYAIREAPDACDAPADVGWVREQPTEGWIRAGESVPVSVRADATGMGGGPHVAHLCIATSSASQPLLTVPVTLTVLAPDAIFANDFENGPNPPAVYASRDEFLSHVQAGYSEENFNDVPANQPISTPLTYSDGIFSYSIYTQDGAASGLYTWPYVVSHNNSGDQIVVTFTTPVTAVGGNFWESNLFGEETGGPIWLTLSDGTFYPFGGTLSPPGSFHGVITASPITSLTIDSPNGFSSWAKLDNLIVGNKKN